MEVTATPAAHDGRPEGCHYYHRDEKGNEFIVWGPPPPPGDALCRMLTGRSEERLVQEILSGKYNHILGK